MKKWIVGAAGAVALACAAIGIPMWLEAGTSSTNTASGASLVADFQSTNAVSGAVFAGSVNAETTTQSFSSHTTGPENSSRADSTRAGDAAQTVTFSYISVSGWLTDEQGQPIAQGFGSGTPTTLTVSNDLSTGKLVAQVDLDISGPLGYIGRFPISIDLDFNAIGGLQTSRDIGHTHVQSPRALYETHQTYSLRNAQATGTALLLGLDLAADGSTYAQIEQFNSTYQAKN